jgi:adenylate cyclase
MKVHLPEELIYHELQHTANVEKAAIRFARLEGLSDYEIMLLRTAVYYHDSGFMVTYHNNEDFGIKLAQNNLPKFGFSDEEIEIVCGIINATKYDVTPKTILEKIMCDADHDYFGRADYANVSKKLRQELENVGEAKTDLEWINFQIDYLENHHVYYTETAKNIRDSIKKSRIQELHVERDRLLKLTDQTKS